MIFFQRARNLRADARTRIRGRIVELQHRHIGRAHARAAPLQTVAQQIVFQHRHRTRERRHHGKAVRQQAGEMKARFADADHRRIRQCARRIEPGVVETRDHMRVRALRVALGDAREDARHREGIVIGALDRGRAERGFHCTDDRIGPRGLSGSRRDGFGHGRGGVAVDDVEAHGFRLLSGTVTSGRLEILQ